METSSGLLCCCSHSHLIIGHNMNCASHVIVLQLLKLLGLVSDALTSQSTVPMNYHGKDLVEIFCISWFKLRLYTPENDRIDGFQMATVGRNVDLNLFPVIEFNFVGYRVVIRDVSIEIVNIFFL